jgi:hypothetical protein
MHLPTGPNLLPLAFDMTKQTKEDQYSEEEAQRRFIAAVKAGLNTSPKPLKSMTPKRVRAQSKKRQKKRT